MEEIFVISDEAPEQIEQLGTKYKFWFEGNQSLFKEGIPGTGENWAEILAARLCDLLKMPHANYNFATWKEKQGVVTENFVPPDGRLVLGNEMLAKIQKEYDLEKKYHQRNHCLRTVLAIMQSKTLKIPIECNPALKVLRPIDIFVGYVLLDALIANQDRHHQNWGVILAGNGDVYLTPTFDHASGFGCHETDENRTKRLTTKDHRYSIEAYAAKAKTPLYSPPPKSKQYTTIEALAYAKTVVPLGVKYWQSELQKISAVDFEAIVDNIQNNLMTTTCKVFTLKLLQVNRARILAL